MDTIIMRGKPVADKYRELITNNNYMFAFKFNAVML